jgi:hypothetical protein
VGIRSMKALHRQQHWCLSHVCCTSVCLAQATHPLCSAAARSLDASREWPYEHIVPGVPRNDPPYNAGRQKGHKRQLAVAERKASIEAAMARMPQLIADYRVRLPPAVMLVATFAWCCAAFHGALCWQHQHSNEHRCSRRCSPTAAATVARRRRRAAFPGSL